MGDEGDPPERLSRSEAWHRAAEDECVDVDELYRMLADERRRRVLRHLLEHEETTMRELVDVVVGWQASTGAVVGPEEHERVAISLHHVHLPLLDQSGLLCYDPGTGAVRFGSPPEAVRQLIRLTYWSEGATEDEDEK
jgi:hypothetical protein